MYRSTSPYAPPAEIQAPYASPYAPAPAAPGSPYAGAAAPASPQSPHIAPGSITYTTSTNPDGRLVYHPFKAVPARPLLVCLLKSINVYAELKADLLAIGVVSGIQWVPAEATQILPPGAQPASTDFAEAWHRGNLTKEDKHALKDWQRAEDKRRRKEEKESAKILREKERLNQARYEDDSLRHAREQDLVNRERRKSFNAGVAFPGSAAPGGGIYNSPPSPYQGYAAPPTTHSPQTGYTRERKYSTGGGILSDLDNQFGSMGISDAGQGFGRPRKYSTHEPTADRTRKISGNFGAERPPSVYGSHSPNMGGGGGVGGVYAPPQRPLSRNSAYGGGHSPNPSPAPLPYGPPRPHSRNASVSGAYPQYTNPSPGLRSAEPAGGAYVPHAPRPSSPYASPNYLPSTAHVNDPYARGSSPFAPHAPLPQTQDVYPPGHVMEGHPIPRSRATTPIPGAAPSGYPSAAGGYPPPVGPPASHTPAPNQQLSAPECFSRPINGAHPYTPFETMKIQDMNDFFDSVPRMPAVLQPHDVYAEDWARLVEDLTLAWSGRLPVPTAPGGQAPKRATVTASLVDLWNQSFFNRRGIELVLYKGRERRSGPLIGQVDMHLPSTDHAEVSTDSDEDDDDDDDDDEARYTAAYGRTGYAPDMAEIRQRRIAEKAERKRRKKEKKNRQMAREREKKYTLYLTCVSRHGGHAGAIPPAGTGAGYGAAPPSGYGVPAGAGAYTHAGSSGYGGYGGGI
ncbi:hypothetical protein V5O48_001247 [Marasmius crinis-equi]|uniref:Uncharacterized protein n=1 Tax=Marasmius crinis-equi TaxID=585013 RepID=A0ABR3FZA5_9AGAR